LLLVGLVDHQQRELAEVQIRLVGSDLGPAWRAKNLQQPVGITAYRPKPLAAARGPF
jgi:hypothetical protein